LNLQAIQPSQGRPIPAEVITNPLHAIQPPARTTNQTDKSDKSSHPADTSLLLWTTNSISNIQYSKARELINDQGNVASF
jgi:hypothetical protein